MELLAAIAGATGAAIVIAEAEARALGGGLGALVVLAGEALATGAAFEVGGA